jgi:GGDEF domain-containing protein
VRAFAELLGAVGLVAAANAIFFPDDPGFLTLDFNPYFVPVLLVAVRYGTFFGLATGLLSAAWIAGWTRTFDPEDGALVVPGLLVLLGVLTGALSRGQGRRLDYYRRLARRLRRDRELARRTLEARGAVVRELQSRVETEAVSAAALYRMSRGMTSERPQEMYEAILRIVAGDLDATRAAVYEGRDEGFALAASHDGRLLPRPFAPTLAPDAGLPGLALRLNRAVSIFDPEAAGLPDRGPGAGVLCGPIGGGGEARALVLIDDLPLVEFGPAVVQRFAAILAWAQETSSRARRREGASDPAQPYSDVGVYRPRYFADLLKREVSRARRYGHPLRLLRIDLVSYEQIPPERRRAVRELVSRALYAYTRDSDCIGQADREDAFLILLPMCGVEEARTFSERIAGPVARVTAGHPVRLSFAFVDPEGLVPEPCLEAISVGAEAA